MSDVRLTIFRLYRPYFGFFPIIGNTIYKKYLEKYTTVGARDSNSMASQTGSTRARPTSDGTRWFKISALSFVVLIGILNVATNRLLTHFPSVLPPSFQFDYAVTVPLTPLGASVLFVTAAVLAIVSMARFVESVGGAETGWFGTAETGGFGAAETESPLWRLGRAVGVVVGGAVVIPVGFALLVVPGLVGLVYLPFVFIGVVLGERTITGALEASHVRIVSRPVVVVPTVLATGLGVAGIGAGGLLTSVIPPAIEFLVGGTGVALVVLAGMRRLTALYQRLPVQTTPTESGRL